MEQSVNPPQRVSQILRGVAEQIMDKQQAHQLLDRLDPSQFDAVVRLLEVMTDPATAVRDAPVDDEPESEEEERAVAASKEWFRNHQGIPIEEVAAELGFSMEQIRGRRESA